MAKKMTKAERLAESVSKAVGAGQPVAVETVDFSDPNRPPTCLEIDFPILPVNRVATIEAASGAAKKPVYQLSKWWARRQSSVFRSLIISAATRAPDDRAASSKVVWDSYYANHQMNSSLSKLKLVDPFMGGGTTVFEASRLGLDVTGVDLNPVAWFIVKAAISEAEPEEVTKLLEAVEAEVRPQLMPFYACDCPRGCKGKWVELATGKTMSEDFEPLRLAPEDRHQFQYKGPELVYVFWAKHGPCQVTGCGHRTPIFSSPVVAAKTVSIRYWPYRCENPSCAQEFDIDEQEARLAPAASFVVSEKARPFTVNKASSTNQAPLLQHDINCPHCNFKQLRINLPKKPTKKKKVELSILVGPSWLTGATSPESDGAEFGGTPSDSAEATAAWNSARAAKVRLIEVRGKLLDEIIDPVTGSTLSTGRAGGTVPKRSNFSCGACGKVQDVLTSIKASGKAGPTAAYAYQGYCPTCDSNGEISNGRFFAAMDDVSRVNAATHEWHRRKENDLASFWPRSELPFGFMTHQNNGGLPNHGFTHWWKMFHPRQLLAQSLLLKAISRERSFAAWSANEVVLGAFQQFLRYCNAFSIWHRRNNQVSAFFSSANFQPKSSTLETSVFSPVGDGSWRSAINSIGQALDWKKKPWELVSRASLETINSELAERVSGKSEKVYPGDPPISSRLHCGSATKLENLDDESVDLVITDPPFGGILHYSELSDFFYVWLRLALRERYPQMFEAAYVPKSLEVVENRARNPENPAAFYQRLLTQSWAEARRVLKAGGILAFTFHHSEDEPWVQVLQSLFDAGFYLEATYPIRSDETKGAGSKPGTIGSQKVEYDIIHVCRKRRDEPKPVSWAKMRRAILREVRQLQSLLEHHQESGLPDADIQVIRRGKALEYYSRHYGQVYQSEGQPLSVKDAVLGVLQVLDEYANPVSEPPPATASPYTRQLIRMFGSASEQPRDQVQKLLRGTGISPDEFETRGWLVQRTKVYHLTPFMEIAKTWQGKHRANLVLDYDQAAVLIGSCFDGSGIKAEDTLTNPNFKAHPGLGPLLQWFASHSSDLQVRTAAGRADRLFRNWLSKNTKAEEQLLLFSDDGADD